MHCNVLQSIGDRNSTTQFYQTTVKKKKNGVVTKANSARGTIVANAVELIMTWLRE